jgi:23S rRNA (guanosine2251-2'-O)-methyltransferase
VADRGHVVYGLHAAEAVLRRRAADVLGAAVLAGETRGKLAELITKLESLRVPLVRAGRDELDRRAQGGVHQGIVLEVPPPRELGQNELEDLVAAKGQKLRLLVLDQVEDPRNLGACLRTADAAGTDAVVVPRAHSAKLGGTALKAATGAAETVPLVVVPNLARTLRSLKDAGVWVIGADESGQKTLFETEMRPPVALVLGAEGRGLRRLTLETCDEIVRIPMQGAVESLNVSVAAGIVLFELLRQDFPRR